RANTKPAADAWHSKTVRHRYDRLKDSSRRNCTPNCSRIRIVAIKNKQQEAAMMRNAASCLAPATATSPGRHPAKAICTIEQAHNSHSTANTVFGQLFNDCQTEALIGRRLLSLIGRRGGANLLWPACQRRLLMWQESCATQWETVRVPPTGPAARLLPPDTTGRPLFNLLPGCRPPPKGETSATFAASVLAAGCDHPCSVHSVHPLLAKLLLGQSAKRLVGEPIDSVLPGSQARHCPALVAAGSGSYTGEALHSSGTAVPVAYHLKTATIGLSKLLASATMDAMTGKGLKTRSNEVRRRKLKPKPKTKLSSRYEVTLHLGRGAYGYVKAAVRRSDGAQVVVKFVRKSKLAAHQLMERPESLGGGLVPRRTGKPSLLRAGDAPTASAWTYSSSSIANPSLDEPLASYMFRQMASAVAYLHSRGIAHRDLKDENVILDERFCLMLDRFRRRGFCLARQTVLGVLRHYGILRAREILQGHPYFGPEADVWSLGVTLYTLVFGENPFFDVDETLAGVAQTAVETVSSA
uniref:Protein kinase domain-containing protein n=1 Tax=Macrostomum lignano TaxID=282301 RepID=A0A1I8JNJ6_9PLAT